MYKDCLGGDSKLIIFVIVLSVMSGCASTPKLDQIPNGETVSIVVAMNPTADGQTDFIENNPAGENMAKGAVGGAFLGPVFLGPVLPALIPVLAASGAAGGRAVDNMTASTGGNLSTEQAIQLSGRMLRLDESHDKLAELAININDRAEGTGT